MTTLPLADATISRPPFFFARAVFGTVKAVMHVVAVLQHRREAALLLSANDRMLADIGLTRGDITDAFAEPLWRDPTALLESRVHERRCARRGNAPWPPFSAAAPSIVPPDGAQAHRAAENHGRLPVLANPASTVAP